MGGVPLPESLTVAALLSTRLGALVLTAPALSARAVPRHLKVALVVLLTVLLWPVAASAAPTAELRVTASTLLTEAVVGLLLGLGAMVFVAAAESAGDTLAVQMGLSGANIVDPLSETQMPVLGQFMGLFVLAILVSTGGHVFLVESLALSLTALPPGQSLVAPGQMGAVVGLGSTLFLLGLRFAAPVVAAMMIGNAALGVVAKTVPQLNVLMVAFPVQIALGLFVLSVTLPFTATFFTSWPETYTDLVSGLLAPLTSPPAAVPAPLPSPAGP